MDFWCFGKLPQKREAGGAYAGSGRSHSQSKTAAMQPLATMRNHMGVGVNQSTTAHTPIMAAALRLARRLTQPPACQFCSMGPNRRWFHSQACMRGELRMAAQPAIKIKTVVGKPGINTPATPMSKESAASPRSSQRVYQRRATAGVGMAACGGGTSGLAGKDMA